MELHVTRGISNSGKSTWAEEWLNAAPNRARVNRDVIRETMFGGDTTGDHAKERVVSHIHEQLLEEFLLAGKDTVVDNMHLSDSTLRHYRKIANKYGATLYIHVFTVALDVALIRSQKRAEDGGLFVPEKDIRDMFKRFSNSTIPDDLKKYVVS